jgi:alpha-amylase
VWEPHLPRTLREAGVEYVVVDDHHFALAGLDADTLGGYYLTEEQGATLAVFPISERLRYLVPFADPAEALRHLEGRREAGTVTLVDDGEKFGVWPGTHRLVYEEGWLARFFETLGVAPWLEITTFSRVLDETGPAGRVYLPAASYSEMGGWALPAPAAEELEEIRQRLAALPDGDRLPRLLRGGLWRNFLVKYPEVGDLYWRMLALSERIHRALQARPGDAALLAAREALWRAQANDAYWHGIFGGCYLPHLRRAVRSALITAEAGAGGAPTSWHAGDVNGDGRAEVRVRAGGLTLTVCPEAGGTVTELGAVPLGLDVADVMTRRREAYHARIKETALASDESGARSIHERVAAKESGLARLLEYDAFRRASFADGFFAAAGALDPLAPWDAALIRGPEHAMRHAVAESADEVRVELTLDRPAGVPLAIGKSFALSTRRPALEVRYRLRWEGAEPLAARWGVQLNLALTAGEAPGRYFRFPGRPSLGSRGTQRGRRGLAMVDEWLGGELTAIWAEPAEVGWAPLETVSLSEAGFERIYQATAILLAWPLALLPGDLWEAALTVSVGRPA